MIIGQFGSTFRGSNSPDCEETAHGTVHVANNVRKARRDHGGHRLAEGFAALGSGEDFALGALSVMLDGDHATALAVAVERAVRVAERWDCYTGGPRVRLVEVAGPELPTTRGGTRTERERS